MITSKYSIREQNEAIILRQIIDNKTISRAELAVTTGLNKASVSAITKKLIDDDLVVETGIGNGSNIGGRKPILLAFNPKSATAISLDLGYNYLEACLSYLDGQEIMTVSKRRLALTAANVMSLLKKVIDSLIAKEPSSPHGIVGITIAIHGLVYENKTIFTPYYDLDKIDLVEELSHFFSYPILIENEANLTGIGEYTFSSNYDSLVSLSLHSGIGAGIVEDGKLQIGKHGKAGEIGHSTLIPAGKKCPCGNHGCLEQYASNKVVFDKIAAEKNLSYVDSTIASSLYYRQDSKVIEIIEESAYYLSVGINNIITLYDPEIVIINSSLYREIPEMLTIVESHLNSHFSKKIGIQGSSLKDKATLYGALAVTSQNFLNVQKLKILADQ